MEIRWGTILLFTLFYHSARRTNFLLSSYFKEKNAGFTGKTNRNCNGDLQLVYIYICAGAEVSAFLRNKKVKSEPVCDIFFWYLKNLKKKKKQAGLNAGILIHNRNTPLKTHSAKMAVQWIDAFLHKVSSFRFHIQLSIQILADKKKKFATLIMSKN